MNWLVAVALALAASTFVWTVVSRAAKTRHGISAAILRFVGYTSAVLAGWLAGLFGAVVSSPQSERSVYVVAVRDTAPAAIATAAIAAATYTVWPPKWGGPASQGRCSDK